MAVSKWVYAFSEGDGKNKHLLGGKGANLCVWLAGILGSITSVLSPHHCLFCHSIQSIEM